MATTEERLKQYEDLYAKAAAYDPTKFQTDFKKAYNEAQNYNADLINQQSAALGELQAVAPTARERYANSLITDPTKQMALIAQARQAPITDWSNAANLLTARGNKFSDILSNALGAYTQSATTAQNAAQNAWQLYQDAVQRDQFRRSQGGGSGGFDLSSLLVDSDGDGIPDAYDSTPNGVTSTPKTTTNTTKTSPYFNALVEAAQWQPENNTLANIYNGLTNTVGKFVYENPTPIDWIKSLFNRNK